MKAYEILQSIRKIKSKINYKLSQISELKALAEQITQTLSSDIVQGSKDNDKIGKIVSKIADLENELDKDIEQLVIAEKEATKIIELAPSVLGKEILYRRYIQGQQWVDIAEELGYSYQWIWHIHKKVLQHIDEYFETI